MDNIELIFGEGVLEFIVDKAVEFKLGARGLRSICEAIMLDAMFDSPSSDTKEFTNNNRLCDPQARKDRYEGPEGIIKKCP